MHVHVVAYIYIYIYIYIPSLWPWLHLAYWSRIPARCRRQAASTPSGVRRTREREKRVVDGQMEAWSDAGTRWR
jgi:hypothetical protein